MESKTIEIHNRIYDITYTIYNDNEIYVENFFIKPEHQGKHRKYSKRIFNSIMDKHNSKLLYGECFPHLVGFYKKCGFIQWTTNGNSWGGQEMWLIRE